jgi:hypothetical protein
MNNDKFDRVLMTGSATGRLASPQPVIIELPSGGRGSKTAAIVAQLAQIHTTDLSKLEAHMACGSVQYTPSGTDNPLVMPAEEYEFHCITRSNSPPIRLETSMGRKRVRSNKGRSARVKAKRRAKQGLRR